jgi:hypothetical protein
MTLAAAYVNTAAFAVNVGFFTAGGDGRPVYLGLAAFFGAASLGWWLITAQGLR